MLHSFGAEEIQCNIDVQCKKKKQHSNYPVIYSAISYSFQKDDIK